MRVSQQHEIDVKVLWFDKDWQDPAEIKAIFSVQTGAMVSEIRIDRNKCPFRTLQQEAILAQRPYGNGSRIDMK